MILRVLPLILVLFSAARPQDAPRSKASDYPVHTKLPALEIGAEYLVHSIPAEKGSYFAKEYLVVEVILVPADKERPATPGQFTLRVNGKTILYRASPGEVAAALKYPDWEQRPTLTAGAGIGDTSVGIGAPQVGRFPGDQRQPRLPPAPRVPEQPDPSGAQKQLDKPMELQISEAALPEGLSTGPVKGCLFFQFRGKTKSIRSLDLIYDGGDSGPKATLTLR